MRYATRPISDRTWIHQTGREYSRFDTPWSKTLQLLGREVDALRGSNVVIEVDVPERAIRLDGGLRADAKASGPAVVVAFDSKHGPLQYRCDRFVTRWSSQGPDWQHNVRAIALTLESLRAVDRYGATNTGQQYAGWKQIGAAPLAADDALRTLARIAGVSVLDVDRDRLISLARRKAHPDTGGSAALWAEFTRAHEAARS